MPTALVPVILENLEKIFVSCFNGSIIFPGLYVFFVSSTSALYFLQVNTALLVK